MDLAQLAIRADSSDLVRAKRDLDALPQSSKRAESATSSLTKSYSALGVVATRLIGVLGAAGLARSLLVAVDATTKYTAQLKLATESQAQFNVALADVQRIARTSQSEIGSVATLYARLNSSLREFNVTQAEVARITENVGLALKVSGATASEASSAILQLSQAFASGILRGEEFNAVSESAPALMRALADSIGVPIGQLRMMAAEGKITGEVLNKAFSDEKLLEKFRLQAKEINTVSGSWSVLTGEISAAAAGFAQSSGLVDLITGSINALSRAMIALRENLSSGEVKEFFARMIPGGGVVADVFKFAGVLNRNRRIATGGSAQLSNIANNPNSIGGAGAITSVGNISPNFNVTPSVVDVREVHRLQEQQIIRQRELNALRDEAAAKQNKEEVARLTRALWIEDQITLERNKKAKEAADLQEKLDKEIHEARQKYIAIEQQRANDNFKEAQEAYRNQVSNYEKIFDRANENLSRSLTDSIVRGFENGEKFITNFKNAITNAFKGYFVNIGVNFVQEQLSGIVGNIGKSLLGAVGLGEGSQTGGFKSVLSDLGSIFTKSNQSIIGGIESVGASIANGMGGIRDTIGGFLGSNASLVANVASYGGAVLQLAQGNWAGAAGTAIGTALGGPIGGAIGSFLGGAVGSLFGGKKIPRTGDAAYGNYEAGKLNTSANVYGKSSLGAGSTLTDLVGAFSNSFSTILKEFDKNAKFSVSADYSTRTNARGGFYANGQIVASNKNASLEDLISQSMGSGLAKAIQNSTAIPQAFKNLFAGLTAPEAVTKTINAVVALNRNSSKLESTLGITGEQVANLSSATGIAGDSLTAFVEKLISAANALKTPAQQLLEIKSNLSSALQSTIGASLPNSIAGFDALLKGINTTTLAGQEMFAALFSIRDQFVAFTNAMSQIKSSVADTIFGLRSPQEQAIINQQKMVAEFAKFNLAVPTTSQQLIAIGEGINYTTEAGLNLALAFPSLVQAFQAVNQEVTALNNSLNPNRFRTFTDFVIASSYARAGQSMPAANMPSYAVGTSYVPNDGVAMLHQGEAVLTKAENRDRKLSGNQVVNLLTSLVSKVSALEYDLKRTADGTQRTARELEDITGGDVTIQTQAA